MTFLNPLVLLGLVAAGIPLIIHLFNFRRPRRIDFSSLAFVRELQKSTMQRVRLKQWLLLLLRTLAIAMLVLSFARPTVTGGLARVMGGHGRSTVAIVIDNSASMELRDAGGAYLDQARTLARAVAQQLEAGDEAYVIPTAGGMPEPEKYQSAASAAAAIDRLAIEPAARPTRAVLNEAAALVAESENVNREIYLISDLQRRTMGDSLDLEIEADIALMLLPVGERQHVNVAIEDVRVESRIVEVGAPVRLAVTVRSFGDTPIAGYGISLYLGDERVAQAPVDLQPGTASEVSLVVTPQQQGWLAGRVEGEDDAFVADNVHFFTLQVPARRRVLLVGAAESETRYVRLALTTQQRSGQSFFDVEQIPATALSTVLTRLGTYDAVMLVGAAPSSSGELAAIEQYVSNGGGVLLMPGSGAAPEQLNGLLRALGGGRVSGVIGQRGGGQPVAAFEQVDAEHPIFEGVFEQRESGQSLSVESPRVLAMLAYTPASGTEQTLIRLTNGQPFLQEVRHGRGVVLLMSVAPELSWSDLPTRGLFVPLIYRTLQYLAASEAVQGEDILVGAETELRLAGVTGTEPIRVVAPFGEETRPEQREVPGAVLLRLSDHHRVPGIYDVYEGERLIRRLAANVDRAESDLQTIPAGELATQLEAESGAGVRILEIGTTGATDPAAQIRAQRSGAELWNVFLVLALLFLVSEMIVARRWRPEAVAT